MKAYKYIFIDLDDTIWDFQSNAKETLQEIYHTLHLSKHFGSFEDFFDRYKTHNLRLWEAYGKSEISKKELAQERFYAPLQEVGVADSTLAESLNSAFLQQLPFKTKLKPFARELLTWLKERHYPITLISNGFEEVQYQKINHSQLDSYFDHIVLSEQVGALKPDPTIYQYALKINQATPNEVLMIGDNYQADIIGANSVGIDAVFLSPNEQETDNTKQIFVIKHLNQILDIIQ